MAKRIMLKKICNTAKKYIATENVHGETSRRPQNILAGKPPIVRHNPRGIAFFHGFPAEPHEFVRYLVP